MTYSDVLWRDAYTVMFLIVYVLVGSIIQAEAKPADERAESVVKGVGLGLDGWTGTTTPKQSSYQPLLGESRPSLQLSILPGGRESWSHPLPPGQVAFRTDRGLTVQLVASAPCTMIVRLRSGDGFFRRRVALTAGEQVIYLPYRSLERTAGVGSWGKVDALEFVVESFAQALTLDMLDVRVNTAEYMFPGDLTYLYQPITSLNPVVRSWPMYAILGNEKIPPRTENPFHTLQRNLKKLTGRSLPVNPEGIEATPGVTNVILVGAQAAVGASAISESDLTSQGFDGFVIRAKEGLISIAGSTRHGTTYGVYRFLEEQGVRYYENKVQIKPTGRLSQLRTYEIADKPFFDSKRIGGRHSAFADPVDKIGDPMKWVKEKGEAELFDGTAWIDHTAAYLVPKHLYYDQNPEYYALRADGTYLPKETTDVRLMISTSHHDVHRISAQRALDWIDSQSDRRYFVISQADDHEWCQSPRSLAMVYEEGNHSDVMLLWVNAVAREVTKKHPDKILICFAYGPTQPAPILVRPEKNVHVFYAAWPNATSAPCGIRDYDAPENIVAATEIRDWLRVAPGQIGLYEYNMSGYTLYGMAWKVKWAARHGIRGFWYCGASPSFRPLFRYVHSRLNWDPFQDVTVLKNDFITNYYGSAAPMVLEAFDTIYDRLQYGDYDGRMHGRPPADFYEPAMLRRLLECLDTAIEREPKIDSLKITRKRLIEYCLYATRPSEGESNPDQLESFGISLQRYLTDWLAEHQATIDQIQAGGTVPPEYDALAGLIWHWTRVRIDTKNGFDPVIQALIDDPVAAIRSRMVTDFLQKLPDGYQLPAMAFTGGRFWRQYDWKCEPRDAVAVYGTMTDLFSAKAAINLDSQPSDNAVLIIDGQDSDKSWCAPAYMQITINGVVVYDALNPFPKMGWSSHEIKLPAGVLKQGENTIELRNQTSSDSLTSHWYMVSDLKIRFPASKSE